MSLDLWGDYLRVVILLTEFEFIFIIFSYSFLQAPIEAEIQIEFKLLEQLKNLILPGNTVDFIFFLIKDLLDQPFCIFWLTVLKYTSKNRLNCVFEGSFLAAYKIYGQSQLI